MLFCATQTLRSHSGIKAAVSSFDGWTCALTFVIRIYSFIFLFLWHYFSRCHMVTVDWFARTDSRWDTTVRWCVNWIFWHSNSQNWPWDNNNNMSIESDILSKLGFTDINEFSGKKHKEKTFLKFCNFEFIHTWAQIEISMYWLIVWSRFFRVVL